MELRYNSPQQLIDALESRREFWRAVDEQTRKEHQEEERKALNEFRDACRRYGKMNLKDLKAEVESNARRRHRTRIDVTLSVPACPRSMEADLDRIINGIRVSGQKSYRLSRSGSWSTAHHLLTYNPDANETVC